MTKLYRIALFSLLILPLWSVGVVPVLADTVTNTGGPTTVTNTSSGGLTNPLNNINSLPEFMNAILDAVVQLGSIVLLLAIVYVGFLFVKAQGKEEEIKSARSALMWTVIGGLILLGAKTIGLVIASTVGAL
jgi:hypothetical protein|tara:strand:- start:234258 stop:234653 length:396 start_codon:yes stop_codon:yes gene_type:complete